MSVTLAPMADEQAGEPLAGSAKRRTTTRGRKRAAEPPATIEPDVIQAWSEARRARPAVVEDGASFGADQVTIHQGAAGRVEAAQVSVEQGAIGAARADHLK